MSPGRERGVVQGMSSFFIAMGQGVISTADMEVFTEALLSCTFIAGHSASRTRGGAFHYPANTFDQVRSTLDQWMLALRPTRITLVFAEQVSPGMGTPQHDRARLQSWLARHYPTVTVTTTEATAACMTLIRGQFYAGSTGGETFWDPDVGTDLISDDAGVQSGYTLFDSRLSEATPAFAQQASTGHRRRRSRKRDRCVIL
jgi:hypothetical protein